MLRQDVGDIAVVFPDATGADDLRMRAECHPRDGDVLAFSDVLKPRPVCALGDRTNSFVLSVHPALTLRSLAPCDPHALCILAPSFSNVSTVHAQPSHWWQPPLFPRNGGVDAAGKSCDIPETKAYSGLAIQSRHERFNLAAGSGDLDGVPHTTHWSLSERIGVNANRDRA
jgi:hypothetical protein